MIPLSGENITGNIVIQKQPSLSYKMKLEKEHIEKTINGIEAVKQMIYKTLMTERYKYEIYSWNYGIELDDLFGKSKEYVKAELPRRIEDALIIDDRVEEITDFEFKDTDKTTLSVSFTVKTNIGEVDIQNWEVKI